MVVVYATLIIKGKKTIEDVPSIIEQQVKDVLVDMDLPELAEQTKRTRTSALFVCQKIESEGWKHGDN